MPNAEQDDRDMTVTLAIVDGCNLVPVCERCVIAERVFERMKGLLGASGLDAGEGMLLRPAPSIHTWFMRFTIDAVFLDADMRVLRIVPEMRPWRMASKRGARVVLELSAGEAARRGIRTGQTLQVTKPGSRLASDEPAMPAHDENQAGIHTLVISRDLVYRSHVLGALSKLGPASFALATADGSDDVVGLVRHERTDVVVLDATASSKTALDTVAALRRVTPQVGVVVVYGEPDDAPAEVLAPLEKWAPADALGEAVERAYEQMRSSRASAGS